MEPDSVSWTRIESLVKILADKVRNTGKEFNSISTISRGGFVPARLIADHLDIHEILVDKNIVPFNSLFVDDIYDSGDTFKKIISKSKDPNSLVYATLFARKGKKHPNQLIFTQKTQGTEYVVFPWDKLEHKRM